MRGRRALSTGAVAVMLHMAVVPAAIGLELVFDRLNGTYENLVADVEPIQSGPVTIRLSSPEHRLELLSHALELSFQGGTTHAVRGDVRFSGVGLLVAAVDFGGIPASLQDQVEFPEQRIVVEGTVRIDRVPEGYTVTVDDLPGFVDVEVRSQLGSELVAWCSRLALFVAGGAACEKLDQELSHPRLPLPAPGASVLVRSEDLTAAERAEIDRYLAGNTSR